jgi:hypothetical protein
MIDFLRNLTKSAEEKRQERLNAYLDGELAPRELEQFERELAQDRELEAEVEALRQVQMSVSQLPRMKAPRNYTLDPAVYGRPVAQPSRPLYPALRLATALTAFFFVLAVALDLLTPIGALEESVSMVSAPQEAQMEEAAGETAPRTDSFAGTPAPPAVMMEEAPQEPEVAADAAEEEPVEEEAAEEEAVEEAEEMMDEAAQTEEAAPGIAAPEATVAGADGAAEVDAGSASEAADSAMNTAEAEPLEVLEAEQEEGVEAVPLPTPAADSDDAAVRTAAEERADEPFPWLLLAEVLLGVALLGLVVMMLLARRSEVG